MRTLAVMRRIPRGPNVLVIGEANPTKFMSTPRTNHMITPIPLLNPPQTLTPGANLRRRLHHLHASLVLQPLLRHLILPSLLILLFPLLRSRDPLVVFAARLALVPYHVVFDAGFGAAGVAYEDGESIVLVVHCGG